MVAALVSLWSVRFYRYLLDAALVSLKTGCGCCTNLTLECPVLSVSPFTGSVLSEDLCFSLILSLRSCIELSFGWKCSV